MAGVRGVRLRHWITTGKSPVPTALLTLGRLPKALALARALKSVATVSLLPNLSSGMFLARQLLLMPLTSFPPRMKIRRCTETPSSR